MRVNSKIASKIGGLIGGTSASGRTASYVRANRSAYGLTQKGVSKKQASKTFAKAIDTRNTQIGRRAINVGMGVGGVGALSAMRPNSNQSRTAYRGPMQTGRGVGRYS